LETNDAGSESKGKLHEVSNEKQEIYDELETTEKEPKELWGAIAKKLSGTDDLLKSKASHQELL